MRYCTTDGRPEIGRYHLNAIRFLLDNCNGVEIVCGGYGEFRSEIG
jgi:hypothetical protein